MGDSVKERLARIEQKQDDWMVATAARHEEIRIHFEKIWTVFGEQKLRVDKIEGRGMYAAGVGSMAGLIIGVIIRATWEKLQQKMGLK